MVKVIVWLSTECDVTMVQIVRQPNIGGQLGETLGNALSTMGTGMGEGLNTGLTALANLKMQQLQQRNTQSNTAKGLQAIFPNMTKEQAETTALLDPQSLNVFVKQKMQEPANMAYAQAINALMSSQPGQPIEAQPGPTQGPGPMQGQPWVNIPPQLNAQQAGQLAGLAMQKQGQQLKRELAEQQLDIKKQQQVMQSYQQQRKELQQAHAARRAAREEVNSLRNILSLAQSGNLNLGKYQATLEKFGLDKFFTTPTTDMVRSYLARSTQAASTDYGTGKLTNKLMEFESLATPALWNTKVGFEANVKNLIIRRKARYIRDEEISRIEEKYKKKNKPLPPDVIADAERKVEPRLQKLAAKEIENNLEAMEKVGASPLPRGKEGDEGYLPGQPDIKWHFSDGKWHAHIQEEEL